MANQKLNEVTTVPTASINNVKTFLAVMNDGSIQQMTKADMATVLGELIGLIELKLKISDKNGAFIASGSEGGIVLAVDRDNPQSLLLYAYSYQIGSNTKTLQIASNNLSIGATNNSGTITVTGGTNVVQYRLGFQEKI